MPKEVLGQDGKKKPNIVGMVGKPTNRYDTDLMLHFKYSAREETNKSRLIAVLGGVAIGLITYLELFH